jgi:hypothetical protein
MSSAYEKLAEALFARRVPLKQIENGIMLACARKYVALCNSSTDGAITSFGYFQNAIERQQLYRSPTITGGISVTVPNGLSWNGLEGFVRAISESVGNAGSTHFTRERAFAAEGTARGTLLAAIPHRRSESLGERSD